jgi:hypothetical protein
MVGSAKVNLEKNDSVKWVTTMFHITNALTGINMVPYGGTSVTAHSDICRGVLIIKIK